ncbi:MAG: alpha-galactosidase [Ignavibacteriota bacterium]
MVFASSLPALDNGLARTPPMGWNSWNKIGCNVAEASVKQAADAMVKSGMKDAGYQYIVIDDCWQVSRDEEGNIVADAQKFPHGIKAVADYVHGLGLKFGIYSDAGAKTCAGRPGSRGYEFQDARTYAKWGVDYLKYDWCNTGKENAEAAYSTMRDALAKTGRPIVFSLCEWGTAKPWTWAANVGNLWRTTTDIVDQWEGKGKDYGAGVMTIVDLNVDLAEFAGPGHWNDPDMLEVGNGGMTTTEYRSHFSLWAMLAAPLMAGNDLGTMKPEIAEILMNREVIAVDQDALGKQGKRVRHENDQDVFVKPLQDGGVAIALVNRGKDTQTIAVSWKDAGLADDKRVAIRDLWQHKDLGSFQGSFSAPVPSHGTVMIRMK